MGQSRAMIYCILIYCILAQGCAVVAVDHLERYRDREGIFSSGWFEGILPGTTSYHQLVEQFGAPLKSTDGPAGSHLASWEFIRQQQKRTSVLGLIRYSRTAETRRYLHVVFQEGMVVRHWRDQKLDVDTARVFEAIGLRQPAPIEESSSFTRAVEVVPPVTPLTVEDSAMSPPPRRESAAPESTMNDSAAPTPVDNADFVQPL